MVLRSLGGELEGIGKLDQVRKILLLGYNDMPYYLKSCLLYMGIFSEDEIVDKSFLINLWIAEGFVEVRPGMTNTEVAESYLNELISRSLIQVADTSIDGSVVSMCRVHDLTYKIILSKCKEHNIVATTSTPHTTILENVRRLVVNDSTFLNEPVHLKHLRTLIVSQKSPSNLSDSSLSQLLKGTSKLVKVLHLESLQISIIPEEVFKLYYLTYLNLDNTNVTNIPESIKNLQNLEYLLLQNTNVKELPSDIIMLKKLSHLGVSGKSNKQSDVVESGFKAPHRVASLCSLRELSYIEADGVEVIQEIGKLTQLTKLGITKITRENGKELCSSLEKLTNLQRLDIQSITANEILDLQYPSFSNHQFLNRLSLSGRLVDIPAWVPSCHGLSELYLNYSRLRQDSLRVLEGLPNLARLYLRDAYIGDTLKFTAEGFQKLKHLVLSHLSGLKSVTIEEGALPYLETLQFVSCTLLEELPQGIQYLSLKTLNLDRMPESLKNNLLNIDKDSDEYKKIAPITEISFGGYINGNWEGEYVNG